MNRLERLIERGEARPEGGTIIDQSYPRDGLCIDCGEALELVEDSPYTRAGRRVHCEYYQCPGCGESYFIEWAEAESGAG